MEFALVIWIGFAIGTSLIAQRRGRSGFGWFILGLLGGIIALAIVALLPDLSEQPAAAPRQAMPYPRSEPPMTAQSFNAEPLASDMKACPECAEPIRAAAVVCRFCGFRFDPPGLPRAPAFRG